MKGLEVKRQGRGYVVTYKGERCKRIGSGTYRIVYELPNTGKVVKVQRDWADRDNESEYEAYQSLRKKVRGCLARVYPPVFKNDVCYVVQDKVEGIPFRKVSAWEERYLPLSNQLCSLQKRTKVLDLHESNVIVSKKTGKLIIVDMGHGIGYQYE